LEHVREPVQKQKRHSLLFYQETVLLYDPINECIT